MLRCRDASLPGLPISMPFSSHKDYLAGFPEAIRARLTQVQQEIGRLIPGATRCISYNRPSIKHQCTFLDFAAVRKRIGIYPPMTQDAALIAETAWFRGHKGNLSFPHHEPLPVELIGRVALAHEYRDRAQ
jgi:uncharacterized protein YdhG (YjbR/CyaY superfamily)